MVSGFTYFINPSSM